MLRLALFICVFLFSNIAAALAAPKNIILLIGDGMGEAEIALTRAYAFDGDAGLFVDTMKNQGSVVVKQFMSDDPTKIQFAGSSGSGATTISTGNRTSDGRIAVAAVDGSPYKTILEEARERGFKTGLVSTARIADATPAAFAAHTRNRYCYVEGLQACKEFDDTPSVAQMINNNVDVMLGGGQEFLASVEADGETIRTKAENNGYTVITKREELLNLAPGTKTYGLFSNGHLPVEWVGPGGRGADFVPADDRRVVIYPEAARCEVNPNHEGIPTIEEMSQFAIDSLKDAENGFFLMIEGASIDKQAHEAKPCGTIGEMLAFDRAAKMAVEFAKAQGDTVVIVTADHGGPTQVIYRPDSYGQTLSREYIPGLYQALLSKSGHTINAYYGTSHQDEQSHSGVNVPIYTYGLDNPEALRGTIQQTEIYPVMKDFLFN